jgi:GDPmannose 4,6-dehydratase
MTPVNPTTPYGAAKVFSQQMARIYRIAYKLRTCSVILYNHESPRRSSNFVTIKVARAVARIKKGQQQELELGSLTGQRDWGWAPDYAKGMWMMLQADPVDDFVLATGQLHSVKELVETAFAHAGLNWQDWVKFDANLLTAVEPGASCGNPAKAQRLLGWRNTVPFDQIVGRLVDSEMEKLARR